MNSAPEKEKILQRIREALRLKAPRPDPHSHAASSAAGNGSPPSHQARAWLPPVAKDSLSQWEQFTRTATDLKAVVHVLDDMAALRRKLCELRDSEGWKKIASHNGSLAREASAGLNLPLLCTDGGYAVTDLESCDAGLTECDALVAQTGSVLITSRSAGGRALSIFPRTTW